MVWKVLIGTNWMTIGVDSVRAYKRPGDEHFKTECF